MVVAEISPAATLEDNVKVGELTRIGESSRIGAGTAIDRLVDIGRNVEIGERVVINSGATIAENVRIGADSSVFENVIVGNPPQDRKYRGGRTHVAIGCAVVLREDVRVERGTENGGSLTSVGDGTLLMSGVYVGHDSHVGSGCVIGNRASLAGHVVLEDHVTIGGHAAIHQFVRVGREAMIGAMSPIRHDVVPFCVVSGNPPELRGLNVRRLRHTLPRPDMRAAHAAFCYLFRKESLPEGLGFGKLDAGISASLGERAAALASAELPTWSSPRLREIVRDMCTFISSRSRRGIHLPR